MISLRPAGPCRRENWLILSCYYGYYSIKILVVSGGLRGLCFSALKIVVVCNIHVHCNSVTEKIEKCGVFGKKLTSQIPLILIVTKITQVIQ